MADKPKKPYPSDDQIRKFMIRVGWDKLSTAELKEKVSDALAELVEQGHAERLIGEDGHFYYKSTKKL